MAPRVDSAQRIGSFAAALIVALSASGPASGLGLDPRLACVVRYVGDGDSLRVDCRGDERELRLHCIDAPELDQHPWGQVSRDRLRALLPSSIAIEVLETDDYGRHVSQIWNPATGANLNLELVGSGLAAVYRRYCDDRRFYVAEDRARERRVGIWSRPGPHQSPWTYRHR